ncbi:hypothetical protein NEOLEDRAFT_44978 [Neolentinus lepideus HHB14362 ss-1]|uniref:N-acetyltransferase domain-containing protein n=1 Tax=Neolentinus lepideus HHB14362 ss-1 TaxID=1314782 RepID=A0A165WA82_9AGAM|nr:hypothetical protein NEOLEDRAFT_44978 [Neolentinus lepideus HHB14362 ss-1]
MPIPSILTSRPSTQHYYSPSSIPVSVLDVLRKDIDTERNTNIILPHLIKCLEKERLGEPLPPNQIWIASQRGGLLDFFLSCTEGPMGPYPIFISTTASLSQLLDPNYVQSSVAALIHELLRADVPRERVFSVFAPEPVTKAFARLWTDLTNIPLARDPEYYAATFSYCTVTSFIDKRMPFYDGFTFSLRPAVERDIPIIAGLGKSFSETSPPFLLSFEQALEEARVLVHDHQIWVHEISQGHEPPDIASIVAFTRVSQNVAAITKVYTNPRWRNKGCAVRLVRRVTKHLLKIKQAVVLYVSHGNPATRVYDQVGFVGLRDNSHEFPGVDRWLELGFDQRYVDLGHW